MTQPSKLEQLVEKLEALAAAATVGDLTTAERYRPEEWFECPFCEDGEIKAADYCNFDHKALGVQFYGIGPEFGAHEKLWSELVNNLPTILAALRAAGDGWEPIETAPRDGTEILAITGDIADERFKHWSRRRFVIRWLGVGDWALFPGMGVGDDWLAGWRPLPTPPTKLEDRNDV